MTKIGSNIKKIRHVRDLSQQAFADIFHLNRGNISSYEENRAEPKIASIIEIANYFSIPIESLLIKDLTINEILQFNANKLIDDEHKINEWKLREVPFISEDILVKGLHYDISFLSINDFPNLKIQESSTHDLLALQFNDNIIHHQYFEKYTSDIVLFFKSITIENIHLIDEKFGLQLEEHKLTLGQFEINSQGEHFFKLNDTSKTKLDYQNTQTYWKLFAHFKHGVI